MKRSLFAVIITLFVSLPAFAKSGIKVLNGDLSVIKNSNITATVVFDYTDLMLEGKPYMEQLESRGSDFVRDWPSESATSEGYNIINFLFVNMETGEVDAQIKCESDGGRIGRYTGLLEQGFEGAGENFAEEFIDLIED